jgi:hypothetical protein
MKKITWIHSFIHLPRAPATKAKAKRESDAE